MLYKLLSLSTLLGLLLMSGCETPLPPGAPPQGPIVNIEDNNRVILSEDEAVEQMVTALASSNHIINSKSPVGIILNNSSISADYSVQFTTLSSRVYRELIATGIVDCGTVNNLNSELIMTSNFAKLQTKKDGSAVFQWNITLKKIGYLDNLFSYSVKVLVKSKNFSTKNIGFEEINPTYK